MPKKKSVKCGCGSAGQPDSGAILCVRLHFHAVPDSSNTAAARPLVFSCCTPQPTRNSEIGSTSAPLPAQWSFLFQGEFLWHTALLRTWPSAKLGKRWPGPIPRGLSKKRYAALYASERIVANDETDELVGHVYLYLKEQLEQSSPPPPRILHGTVIDQFIACGRSSDKANELASHIWLAVIDHMEENEHTFMLLKHLAWEEVFLSYPHSRSYSYSMSDPYSRSRRVQWRVFDRLLTDFRDCLSHADYCDMVAHAKYKFQTIPSSWLGY